MEKQQVRMRLHVLMIVKGELVTDLMWKLCNMAFESGLMAELEDYCKCSIV